MPVPRATVLLFVALVLPRHASAQWYVAGYLGTNHTQNADVHVVQPAPDVDLAFGDATFRSEAFSTPPYYGYRIGRFLDGDRRRLALEFEFIHLKVIANTGEVLSVNGHIGSTAVSATETMDTVLQRYSMTHGLNFLLGNVSSRFPVGNSAPDRAPAAIIVRAGLGPTLPHGETQVFGQIQQQYEWAGVGLHGAAGLNVRIHGRLSANVEYKLTYAKPRITLPGGTGQMTAVTHQLAIGAAFGLTR
jgi:hypothetical protein